MRSPGGGVVSDLAHLRDVPQADHVAGHEPPLLDLDQEVGAAGQHLPPGPLAGEDLDRLGQALRGMVGKVAHALLLEVRTEVRTEDRCTTKSYSIASVGFGTALGAADLHVHSVWSDGLATVPQILAHAEAETDLDILAIADHDQVRGALEAVEWCAGRPGGRLQAVVATEISAAWGRHVLALFFAPPYPVVPFPRFSSLAETVARVHDAGGVIVLPHPFSALVPSVGERTLTRLLRRRKARPELRAVQGWRCAAGWSGGAAWRPACAGSTPAGGAWPPVGSSDAHHLAQIGTARTRFPGRTPAGSTAGPRERTPRRPAGARRATVTLAPARPSGVASAWC